MIVDKYLAFPSDNDFPSIRNLLRQAAREPLEFRTRYKRRLEGFIKSRRWLGLEFNAVIITRSTPSTALLTFRQLAEPLGCFLWPDQAPVFPLCVVTRLSSVPTEIRRWWCYYFLFRQSITNRGMYLDRSTAYLPHWVSKTAFYIIVSCKHRPPGEISDWGMNKRLYFIQLSHINSNKDKNCNT